MTRTYFRTSITVPGPPRPLRVISFSSQPLLIIIAITQTHHGPLEAFQSLSDLPSLLEVYLNQSRLLHANRSPSRPSLPSLITPELPWASQSIPYHFKQPKLFSGPPRTFLVTPYLSQYLRPSSPSSITQDSPYLVKASQTTPDD